MRFWLSAIVLVARSLCTPPGVRTRCYFYGLPTEIAAASLDRLLSGGNPGGVADLKAMQDHVRKLTAQLMKCTVGVQVGAAQGSGVIISKDGYVLTAAHVAGKPNHDVLFILSDGRMLRGKTLGLNRTMDAGLMKIEDQRELPFAELGVSDKLNEGQWCLATGHPGGYQSDRGRCSGWGGCSCSTIRQSRPTARSSAAIPAARYSTCKAR